MRPLAWALVVLLVCGAFIGCSEDVFLGGGGGGSLSSAGSGASGPCASKECGAACVFDPCLGETDCEKPIEAGYCNETSHCTAKMPVCAPYVACDPSTAKCGDPCWPCDPMDSSCDPASRSYTCTDTMKCLPGEAVCACEGVDCPPPLPCESAACGAPCTCDPDKDADCLVTTSPTFCDGNARCLPVEDVACPQGYQPCDNRNCGDICSICKPGDTKCKNTETFVCNVYGECTVAPVGCYQPCSPGRCGEQCSTCDPADPQCVLPPSAYCDEFGGCNPGGPPTYCPCAELTCGATCTICDPNDIGCTEPPTDAGARVCDVDSACVPDEPAPVCP